MGEGFNRAEHCKRIASKGGKATVAKHGAEHMSAIGVKGFRSLAAKFRSVKEAKDWLARIGTYNYVKSTGLPDTGKFSHERPLAPWESGYTEF